MRVLIFPAIIFVVIATVCCRPSQQVNGTTPANVSASPEPGHKAAFQPESTYVEANQLIKVERPNVLDRTNPHQVAGFSVELCRSGATKQLVQELSHVEANQDLGRAFITFINEFGPDLERFKDVDLFLKFEGYKDGSNTSVWYYYLVNSNAGQIEHRPWISVHRSKHDGNCALTGIFLNDSDEVTEMPPDLIRR